jgi:hypothetical protein
MVFDSERLGEEIGKLLSAWNVKDFELALAYTITEPMESHINGLCTSDLEGIVGKTNSGSVVYIDDCGTILLETKGGSNDAEPNGVPTGTIGSAVFGFGNRGDYYIEDSGIDKHWTVEAMGIICPTKVSVGTGSRATLGLGEIRGVGEGTKHHVGGIVADTVVGESSEMTKEAI